MNVYEQMGLPDAEDRLARSEMIIRINDALDERGLTVAEAAHLTGVNAASLAVVLQRGPRDEWPLERLDRFRAALETIG